MGPRLFSRGNVVVAADYYSDRRPFNGAATLQSRKSFFSRYTFAPAATFNGAATLQSRKCENEAFSRVVRAILQWGRDSSVAEIRQHYGFG